jgi:hypothetical protein
MNELLKSYQEILKALAYETNDNGDIYVTINGETKRANVGEDSLPLVLPTTENIRSTTTVRNDGKIIKSKAIFNPYKESAIADTESIVWLRTEILTCINQIVAVATQYLLRLMVSSEHKNDVGEYSSDFLAYVGTHSGDKPIKLDDSTFTKWDQIIMNSFDPDITDSVGLVSLITHRKTKITEGNYTAYARLNIDILDEVNKRLETKDSPGIYRLKCKKDDLRAFKLILDYLFSTENISYPLTHETDTVDAPLSVVLLELYNTVTKIPYNVIKELYHLQESFAEGIPLLDDKRRRQLVSRNIIDSIPALVKYAETILDGNEKKVVKTPILAAIDPNKGRVLNAEQKVTPIQQPMQQAVQQNPIAQQGFQQPIVTSPQTQIQQAQASEKSDLDKLKELSKSQSVWLPVQQVPAQQVPVQYYQPAPQQQYTIGAMNNGYNQGYNGYVPMQTNTFPVYQDPFQQRGPGVVPGNIGYSPLM